MEKFHHADWLRACQLIPNSAKQSQKVAKEKLTDGQSNPLFSNQPHALDGAIQGAIFPRLRDTRAFLLLNHLEIFSSISMEKFFHDFVYY